MKQEWYGHLLLVFLISDAFVDVCGDVSNLVERAGGGVLVGVTRWKVPAIDTLRGEHPEGNQYRVATN